MLLKKKLPFCMFALPNYSEVNIVLQFDGRLSEIGTELGDEVSGLLYKSFDPNESAKIIRADFKGKASDFPWSTVQELKTAASSEPGVNVLSDIDKEDYLAAVKAVVNRIQSGEVEKVVYARTKTLPFDQSPISIFQKAIQTELSTFTYLMYTHAGETWLGATPEVLLSMKNERFHTVSLAGQKMKGERSKSIGVMMYQVTSLSLIIGLIQRVYLKMSLDN